MGNMDCYCNRYICDKWWSQIYWSHIWNRIWYFYQSSWRISSLLDSCIHFILITTNIWKKSYMPLYMLDGTIYEYWNKIRNIFHLPGLRMTVEQSKCIDCKLCTKNCPMGLDVHHMVKVNHIDEYECSMCGECVDHCPKKVISYKFK